MISMTRDPLVPLSKLAKVHGLAGRHLNAAARRGELPAVVVGKRLYARPQDVDTLLSPKLLPSD